MSTQLESWKYFAQEHVQEDEVGEKTLDALPGSEETLATFSMPLMWLQGIMGVIGFLGVISALRRLKGLFDAGVAVEAMKKLGQTGLDNVNYAVVEAQHESFFLLLTVIILKVFLSCGFMGAAGMMEKRVDHANFLAGLVCFAAIIYNMVELGIYYAILPDFSKLGLTANQSEAAMMGILISLLVVFAVKMAIYLGVMTFLNSKTIKEIFTPRQRNSYA